MTGPRASLGSGSGLGRDYDRRLDAMNVAALDSRERAFLRGSSEALLRAQLQAGQHVLSFGQAMVAATALGLAATMVRPGIGDPSAYKLRGAR